MCVDPYQANARIRAESPLNSSGDGRGVVAVSSRGEYGIAVLHAFADQIGKLSGEFHAGLQSAALRIAYIFDFNRQTGQFIDMALMVQIHRAGF